MSGDTREAAQRAEEAIRDFGDLVDPTSPAFIEDPDYIEGPKTLLALAADVLALREQVDAAAQEQGRFLEALWRCYVVTGEDTDGDSRFHMPAANARQVTFAAVEGLRQDYDAACDEAKRAETRIAALEEALDRIAKAHATAQHLQKIARVALRDVEQPPKEPNANDHL